MGDRTVAFRPGPGLAFDIVGDDGDTGVLLSIVHNDGRYEEGVSSYLMGHVARDATVLDVGANIGVLTVLAADLAPAGRVVAFEPSPANIGYLRRNVSARPNVEVVERAVGAEDGVLRFAVNEAYPAGAHLDQLGDVTVDVSSLDSWAADHDLRSLDVLKIDVEGAELDVLSGGRTTIERLRPTIIVECNVGALRRVAGAGFQELHQRLASMVDWVGYIGPGGWALPLEDAGHLELALAGEGVVDLVGGWGRPGLRSALRAKGRLRQLRRSLLGRPTPPERNFLVTAPIDLSIDTKPSMTTGGDVLLRVTIENGSAWWISSSFQYVPVNLGARWIGGAECGRAAFPEPLAPGGTVVLDLPIAAPSEPGLHELEITLVQEHYAWVADLDPRCRLVVPIDVSPS